MFMIFLRYFPNILKNRENLIKIGRPGDCMNFRETPGKIGRVGMSAESHYAICSHSEDNLHIKIVKYLKNKAS